MLRRQRATLESSEHDLTAVRDARQRRRRLAWAFAALLVALGGYGLWLAHVAAVEAAPRAVELTR